MNEIDNISRGDVHGAVGSYVVHALEEPELSEFEAHVAECDQCSSEIASFNEMLAQMSADFEVAPPAELRGSVLSAIAGVSQLPAEPEQHVAPATGHGLSIAPDQQAAEVQATARIRRRSSSRAEWHRWCRWPMLGVAVPRGR